MCDLPIYGQAGCLLLARDANRDRLGSAYEYVCTRLLHHARGPSFAAECLAMSHAAKHGKCKWNSRTALPLSAASNSSSNSLSAGSIKPPHTGHNSPEPLPPQVRRGGTRGSTSSCIATSALRRRSSSTGSSMGIPGNSHLPVIRTGPAICSILEKLQFRWFRKCRMRASLSCAAGPRNPEVQSLRAGLLLRRDRVQHLRVARLEEVFQRLPAHGGVDVQVGGADHRA